MEGEDFRATIEATSRDSQHEVRFQLWRSLLKWDSAACAAAFVATGFTALYVQDVLPMKQFALAVWVGFLLVAFLLTAPLFYVLLSPMRRYRYIYAIEQFKQYYADEQWVAIAEDVFSNYHDDRYYLELRGQCIYNGFGLLVVRENKPPIMQVTPSRQDLFSNRRQLIPLFSQLEINRMAQEDKYPDWLRQFKPRKLINISKEFKYQMSVCLIALLAVIGVLYLESQDRPIKVLEYDEYLAEMDNARQENRFNIMPDSIRPNQYMIDTPFVWPPPYRKDEQAYLSLGLTATSPPGPVPLLEPETQDAGFIMAFPGVAGLITYDCSRLRIGGDAFVVQEGIYSSYSQAAGRIAELASYGLETSGLWLGCFQDEGRSYIVFFGPVFRGAAEAGRALKEYETQLGDNVLDIKLEVHALTIDPLQSK